MIDYEQQAIEFLDANPIDTRDAVIRHIAGLMKLNADYVESIDHLLVENQQLRDHNQMLKMANDNWLAQNEKPVSTKPVNFGF